MAPASLSDTASQPPALVGLAPTCPRPRTPASPPLPSASCSRSASLQGHGLPLKCSLAERPARAASPELSPLVTICHMHCFISRHQRAHVYLYMYVFVSCGCGNRLLHVCYLETTAIYSHTVTEARSLKSARGLGHNQDVGPQGHPGCGGSRREPVLASSAFWRPEAVLGLWLPHSRLQGQRLLSAPRPPSPPLCMSGSKPPSASVLEEYIQLYSRPPLIIGDNLPYQDT